MTFLSQLFDTEDFPARWHCGVWSELHGWVHIVSDTLIWAAYMAIPCALFYFVRKRSDAPFPRIFWLFGAFIFACGTGHLLEAIIFWHPVYRVAGTVKAITAIVSWSTVIVLIPLIPKALGIPGLQAINEDLAREVQERKAASEKLSAVNNELGSFHGIAVDREHEMIELKQRVNELHDRLGEPPEFDLSYIGSEPSS